MSPASSPPTSAVASVQAPETAVALGSLRHNRNFLLLWLAQVACQLGDRIIFVVFVAIIARLYGANESYTSYLYIAFTIPAIVLTAVAGVFVDRWPRRETLVVTNLMRAMLIAVLPLVADKGLWALYSLAFCLSAATQFFVPAEAATIPALVPKAKLLQANSIFTTTMMASVIVGFALGDPLINLFSLKQVHWALVVLFVLAALFSWQIRLPQSAAASPLAVAPDLLNQPPSSFSRAMEPQRTAPPPASPSLRCSVQQFLSEIADGMAYICATPVIWKAMLKLALLFSAVVALCILSIAYSKAFLYQDPAVASSKFAYIVATSGVGMALGAFLVAKPWHHWPRVRLVPIGLTVVGVALLALSALPWLPVTVHTPLLNLPAWQLGGLPPVDAFHLSVRMAYTYGWATVMGVGASLVAIPLQALLHERIPEDKRGKVLGVQFTVLSTSSTLPAVFAGLGSEYVGVVPVLLSLALPFVVVGMVGLRHWRRTDADDTL